MAALLFVGRDCGEKATATRLSFETVAAILLMADERRAMCAICDAGLHTLCMPLPSLSRHFPVTVPSLSRHFLCC